MNKGKNRKLKLSMVYDMNNIIAADKEARKGKSRYYGVRKFDKRHDENIRDIHQRIRDGTYHTGAVTLERRFCDKKWRVLCKAHYYDHVAHHALMRVIMPTLIKSFHHNSAASIEGRGVHYQLRQIKKILSLHKDSELWFAEIDFTKCYHHINRQRLYEKCCKTFHDDGIRRMLHDAINAMGNHNGLEPSDGTEGVGIGLYPTQPLVNFYFNDLDRLGNSIRGVIMLRYCDNLYFIGFNLLKLKQAIALVKEYINSRIQQPIHDNIGIQRLDSTHFVDAVGYKIYKTHTLLRNETKYRFKRAAKKGDRKALTSYKGWLMHCNGANLWQTITKMRSFSELNYKPEPHKDAEGKRILSGEKTNIRYLVGKEMVFLDFEDECVSKYIDKHGNPRTCAWVLVDYDGYKKFSTSSPDIINALRCARDKDFFPFRATIQEEKQDHIIIYKLV